MEECWVIETCLTCHVPFKITAAHGRQLRQSHNTFYCPSGHGMYYPEETKAEKLENELEYKQNHIMRLHGQNEEHLKTIADLRNELKDATEKKVQEHSEQDNKKVVKKTVKKTNLVGRQYEIFDKSQRITKINNVTIGQPIVDYFSEELSTGKFKMDTIETLVNKFYNDKLKRGISAKSVIRYAWIYKKYLLTAGLIVDLGDGSYQLKFGGDSVKRDLPPKKPPVKLSYLEKWLIKTMPKKPFDLEQFYNAYPKQRRHKKNTEAVLSELCAKRSLTQLENNRFKLNWMEEEEK